MTTALRAYAVLLFVKALISTVSAASQAVPLYTESAVVIVSDPKLPNTEKVLEFYKTELINFWKTNFPAPINQVHPEILLKAPVEFSGLEAQRLGTLHADSGKVGYLLTYQWTSKLPIADQKAAQRRLQTDLMKTIASTIAEGNTLPKFETEHKLLLTYTSDEEREELFQILAKIWLFAVEQSTGGVEGVVKITMLSESESSGAVGNQKEIEYSVSGRSELPLKKEAAIKLVNGIIAAGKWQAFKLVPGTTDIATFA